MCGIAGGWLNQAWQGGALAEALNRLVHRGPDDSGQFAEGPVAIGMRRLSIIDLDGGHQPLSNEDDTVWVVFNGEIYNYRELAAELQARGHRFRTVSDTEVLVHLYEDLGPEMCARLRGMFALAIYDSRRKTLFLARDRFGKKPLYYRQLPGGLVFASELKAIHPLVAAGGGSPQIRPQAIYDFLSLGYVPQPDTMFHDTHCVPPGSWLQFDGSNVKLGTYWTPDYTPKLKVRYDEALQEVRRLVAESVVIRLRSDVPIGVFLSSGVDSSVIAWEAAQHVGSSLRTFTVATDDPELNEAEIAQRTAAFLGVQNTVLPLRLNPLEDFLTVVRKYDQPFADSSAIPSLAISRLAREYVTVVLTGDGGDEVFAGYRRYLAARALDRFRWLPQSLTWAARRALPGEIGRRTPFGFARRFFRAAGMPPGRRYLAWTSDMMFEEEKKAVWRGGPVRPTEQWIEMVVPSSLSGLGAQLCGDHRINLLSDMLVKIDIATMAASLEARSPLLDHTIAEFVMSLPDRQRLHRWRRKALLRDAYRERLPAEVIDGRKRGFEIPMRRWLGSELRDLVNDTLGDPASRVGEFLDRQFVSDVIEHRILTARNWEYLVYGLLVLELWLRNWFESPPAHAAPPAAIVARDP